jgi:hypothetical protein
MSRVLEDFYEFYDKNFVSLQMMNIWKILKPIQIFI